MLQRKNTGEYLPHKTFLRIVKNAIFYGLITLAVAGSTVAYSYTDTVHNEYPYEAGRVTQFNQHATEFNALPLELRRFITEEFGTPTEHFDERVLQLQSVTSIAPTRQWYRNWVIFTLSTSLIVASLAATFVYIWQNGQKYYLVDLPFKQRRDNLLLLLLTFAFWPGYLISWLRLRRSHSDIN